MQPRGHRRADRALRKPGAQQAQGTGGTGARLPWIGADGAQQARGAGDVGFGPFLAPVHEDVVVGRDLDLMHGDQPGIVVAAIGKIAGIPAGQHRHAKGHRLDHAETPALGPVERDIGIGAAHQRHEFRALQGRVDKGDARIARQRRVDPAPDRHLRGVVDAVAVVGLEHEAGIGIARKGGAEGGNDGQRVLALDEREAVETGEDHETAAGAGNQRRARPVARDAGHARRGQADADDGQVRMRGIGGDAVV